MTIEEQMELMAGKLEKSTKTEKDLLKDTIKKIGLEGLKKAIPQLSDSQKVLLKEVVVDMVKSLELDFKQTAAPQVVASVVDIKAQEEKADDEADEKIAQAAKNEDHRHQGGVSEGGLDGQVIKSEESNMKISEVIKSMPEDKQQEVADALIAKGVSQEKVDEIFGKAMSKKEASKKIMDMEEKEHGTQDPKKLVEAEKREQTMKKSVKFKGENDRLKAKTGGRNHHFSVNDYYDQALSKSKEETKQEQIKKSEKQDVNELIAKSMDCTADDITAQRMLEENKKKINGQIKKSFSDNEIAAALGLTEEEAKKLLGE